MKIRLAAVVIAVACITCASAAFAVFPVPDNVRVFQMYQGWFEGDLAWYLRTDTNDIRLAQTQGLNLAPKLSGLIGTGAAHLIYVVRNFNQGAVFTEAPGEAGYSGYGRLAFVYWKHGVTPRPITSHLDLPPPTDVDIVTSDIIVSYPIMAIGNLGGPWPQNNSYRIPQGIVHSPYHKAILLPTYLVYSQNPVTKHISVNEVIITDVSDAGLATILGANHAPALVDAPLGDTQNFWSFSLVELIETFPLPPDQLPIIPNAPMPHGPRNHNQGYTPLSRMLDAERQPDLPPSTVIETEIVAMQLTGINKVIIKDDTKRMNTPAVERNFR